MHTDKRDADLLNSEDGFFTFLYQSVFDRIRATTPEGSYEKVLAEDISLFFAVMDIILARMGEDSAKAILKVSAPWLGTLKLLGKILSEKMAGKLANVEVERETQ